MSKNLRNIRDAITADTFTLKAVANRDLQGLQSWLVTALGVMVECYGLKADCSISRVQIETLTSDILDKYGYRFTIADIIMCFKLARQNPSIYGKFYGRFDSSIVMGWLEIYDRQRDEVIPTIAENNVPAYTPSEKDMTRDQYIQTLLKKSSRGDRKAWMDYCAYVEIEMWKKESQGKLALYKYNQKHRFDNKCRRR